MRRFIIERTDAEFTSHSGLALIGLALRKHSALAQAVAKVPLRHGIAHADVLCSYVGLLCLGKSDFDAIENLRADEFFGHALGLTHVPSAATLRQRLDERAEDFRPLVEGAALEFLQAIGARPTGLSSGHVALDADVTPLDNSRTRKEGVSRTYKGHDGYAPMAAYLGREGYCLEFELRAGAQHCQRGTPEFLTRVLRRARRLTQAPLLLRLDGGNDALENVVRVLEHARHDPRGVDFLIKWNPRQETPAQWLAYAERHATFSTPREGKRVALFEVRLTRRWGAQRYELRRVMRVIERTIDRCGQRLLVPDIEVEGWWTSLELPAQEVIGLYEDHGTSEQFHSEFKTDLDIERLPSGKFATNALVLACAVLAYNILRWLGQTGLRGPDAPLRHAAQRRRIRTVMQELMYLAARCIETGRRLKLGFARGCPAVEIFERLYHRLAYG